MAIEAEQHITLLRKLVEKYGIQGYGITTRALLDLADQRDDLVAACEVALAYRDKVGPLSFQLEKMDDYFAMMRAALEKARQP